MRINKCDICKKTIKSNTGVRIFLGSSFLGMHDICNACSEPIIKFLKAKKLINDDKKESKEKIVK